MLSRVDELTRSLEDYIKSFLNGAGYSGLFEFKYEYPHDRSNPLETTIVVFSHDQTEEVRDGEIGGPLALEPVTYNVDVLGKDQRFGRNIASLIKQKLDSGEPIPLFDYDGDPPLQIDVIPYVDAAVHSRVRFANPLPWQQHWNVVTFTVTLEYNRSYL